MSTVSSAGFGESGAARTLTTRQCWRGLGRNEAQQQRTGRDDQLTMHDAGVVYLNPSPLFAMEDASGC